MGDLSNLLFELSSDERLTILKNLQKEKLKLSQVSQIQDITAPEASRHLQRLSDAKLISRDSNGFYFLTMLGKLVFSQLSTLSFISDHSEYFLSHDPSMLSYQFQNRIGELSECRFDSDYVHNINHSAQMVKEAEDYLWCITYQLPGLTTPIIEQRLDDGLEVKFIFPEGVQPSESIRLEVFRRCENRSIPRIEARIVLTDKEAQFGLISSDGKYDYAAFISSDEKPRQLARDVFKYYWERGKLLLL